MQKIATFINVEEPNLNTGSFTIGIPKARKGLELGGL